MATKLETTICIVGAGPAGIVLGNILQDQQIDCLVIDKHSRQEIHDRGRAGTLEHSTIEALSKYGMAGPIVDNGMLSTTCEFRTVDSNGKAEHIEFNYAKHSETDGRYIYPQSALNDELIDRFLSNGGRLLFEHEAVTIDQTQRRATVEVTPRSGRASPALMVAAKFVVGCDGYHGVSRQSVDQDRLEVYEKEYEYQWLTLMAEAPPIRKRIIYGIHADGFAAHVPRTGSLTRYYLQIPASDSVDDWPDKRAWRAIKSRIGGKSGSVPTGKICTKGTMTLRSFVVEPLRFGRLFLAGDAAHLVSPLGGKGMNMAIGDAAELAATFKSYFASKKPLNYLDRYSKVRLPRIWRSEEFSSSILALTHASDDSEGNQFLHKLNQTKLRQLNDDGSFATHFARRFVGIT